MPKHRSISERLSHAKTPEVRESVFCIAMGELKAVTDKRFPALEKVLKAIQTK